MHIGVPTDGFVNWAGGVSFIENILIGLLAVPENVTKITVFVPTYHRGALVSFLGKVKRSFINPSQANRHMFGFSQALDPWRRAVVSFASITPNVVEYDGSRVRLMQICKRLDVDVLFPLMTPLVSSDIKWAGYLYDCQHKYHPEFFRSDEIVMRNNYFEKMLNEAEVVIVNARSVKADLERFFPDKKSKIFPLPFSPILRKESSDLIISCTKSVKNDFLTGEYYFIISNQFWIHKDHRSAFQAFAQVAQMPELREFKLVCTGLTEDYRFPGYFDELKVLVKNLGIQDRVIFTGYIDRLEQLALVNGAVALVQPTLFEGGPGGGSTYDALALGVPCLLSDIPVNLEIKNPLVCFFKAGNAESLAKMLISASSNSPPRLAADILLEKSRLYARGLGLSLFEIANELTH